MKTKRNNTVLERIDSLLLSENEYERIFSDLTKLNLISGNNFLIRRAFEKYLSYRPDHQKNKITDVVDLGCGSGQGIAHVRRLFQKKKLAFSLTGIDNNEILLKMAEKKLSKAEDFKLVKSDILAGYFEIPSCDMLFSSQFLYHFSDEELLNFLERNAPKISGGLIVCELNRSSASEKMMAGLGKMLRFHPITIQDGITAIRSSWKKNELLSILKKSGHFREIRSLNIGLRYALICLK